MKGRPGGNAISEAIQMLSLVAPALSTSSRNSTEAADATSGAGSADAT